MYIPNWGEEVMTGNPQIDEEHRQLFIKIDTLMVAISRDREEAIIQEVLDYFIMYARTHFEREEKLHRECGAPDYEAHLRAHRRVSDDLDEILNIYNAEGLTPHMEFHLVNQVVRGIVEQLHEFDLPLAKFLQEKHVE